MAVPTTLEIKMLNEATPGTYLARLGDRISKLDTDGSLQIGAGATGVQIGGGDWTHLSASEAPLTVGTFASAASGSGVALTRALVTAAARVYADDGGAHLFGAGSVPDLRASVSRLLITHSQSDSGAFTRLFGSQGVLKAYQVGWTDEVHAGVQGLAELIGSTTTFGGNGVTAGVIGQLSTSGTVTIGSTHILAGVAAISNMMGAVTQTGKSVAFLAKTYDTTNWSDATARAAWGLGLYMPRGSVVQGVRVGDWVGSGTAGSAILFQTSLNTPVGYNDGQMDIVAAFGESTGDLTSAISAKVGRFRHLVSGSSLTVAHETYGLVGQLCVKGTTLTHMHAGLMGTFEGTGAAVVSTPAYPYATAAVIARIGGGANIVATTPLAGFSSVLNGADVASGSIAAFASTATAAGRWTWGLSLGYCDEAFNFLTTGACVSAHSVGTITSNKQILVSIDGSPFAMAVYAVGTG